MKLKNSLKIIFAGTPEFAVPTLQALVAAQYEIIGVYTQPDRPAGRGQKLTASPVKQFALQHHLPVFQPKTLRDTAEQQRLQSLQADVMIVVAYGLILPQIVLEIPRYGCINVHASLLPRWRGAAPIQRAILAGDKKTGITIMQMNAGLDTGDILKQVACEIKSEDISADLHERLAKLGAQALLDTLKELQTGKLQPKFQDETQANYAQKIEKAEAKIDWNLSAIELDRKVRAFNPWPIAFTELNGEIIRLWKTQPLPQKPSAKPGTIVQANKDGIDVATSDGTLRILELQLSGGKRMSVASFLNARKDLLKQGIDFSFKTD